MTKIVASASQLRSASTTMEGIASQYQTAYLGLIEAAHNIGASWTGEDNQAFITKVDALQDDFQQMYQLLSGCSNDLLDSANAYEKVQQEVITLAGSLASDF